MTDYDWLKCTLTHIGSVHEAGAHESLEGEPDETKEAMFYISCGQTMFYFDANKSFIGQRWDEMHEWERRVA
jgi:hypothetical protein